MSTANESPDTVRTNAFDKLLQAILGLMLVVILWQLVAVRREVANVNADNATLRSQLEELRRGARTGGPGGTTRVPRAALSGGADIQTASGHSGAASTGTPTAADLDESADTSEEAKWKEQQDAMDRLRTQIQDLLNDMDAIDADLEAIGTAVIELRTNDQTTASELTALTQEVTRLNTAVERLTNANR